EQLVEIENRLPEVLEGKDRPANAAEGLQFASLGYQKKQYAASARLFAEAFVADPKLAEDMSRGNRYNAACSAALAGSSNEKNSSTLPSPIEGEGKKMNENEKTRWRKQAIEWLKADLAFWSKQVEAGLLQAKAFVKESLQHWKVDPDLAGLRDEA